MPTYDARQGRLRGAAAGPHPVRQRRGQRQRRADPYPGFEQSFDALPGARAPRRARGTSAPDGDARRATPRGRPRRRRVHLGRRRAAADELHRQHRRGAAGCGPRRRPTSGAQDPAGTAVAYVTAPLDRGHDRGRRRRASTSWVRSSAPNVDLQATISEVRPDGKETFVQSGWVRGRRCASSTRRKSTPLEPVLSLREADVAPMPARPLREGDDPALLPGARLPRGLAHPRADQRAQRRPADLGVRRDRAGRRRSAGRDRLRPADRRRGSCSPSVPGVDVPTPLPPCPGLRGEPCRDYRP